MNQPYRCRVQDDDLGGTPYASRDLVLEIERQAFEGGGRRRLEEDCHVHVAASARRSPRYAAEQVCGDDPFWVRREELTQRLLDGDGRHAVII